MNTTFIISVVLILAVFALVNAGVLWFILRRQGSHDRAEGQSMMMMQQQVQHLSKTLDEKLSETQKELTRHLSDVTRGVTAVGESSKQVFTIAEQLQSLEQVLKNQKKRGNLGEASLELILSNILPPTSYKLQYQFRDGDTVDAVIETKDGVIPVDAKFSLDNYTRLANESDEEQRATLEKEFVADLKRRIEETAKYIKPKEGTLPFAFMFIPAEAIYYDLLVNEVGSVRATTRSLIDYAYTDKNVIIVSPTTFAAYLQSVLYGFRAFKIEESAKQISKRVEDLSRHLKSYEEYYQKLGNSLATTVNHYNAGYKELGKIDKDIYRITGEEAEIEPAQIEKPEREDT